MAEGPYKRPIIVKQSKEICDYCEHCKASKEFGRNFVKVISARCTHPNVAGGLLNGHLDHDTKEIATPSWCPVKQQKK